jgi:hypothetical protein
VGLLLTLIWYRPSNWRWSQGCLEVSAERILGNPWAQTHGWLIVYRVGRNDSEIRVHERCHVVQGFIGGPFYVLAYGLVFLFAWYENGFRDWRDAYRRNPFEISAYNRAYPFSGKWGEL